MAQYLRIGEVGQALGVSPDTLRRWEVEGRITFERRGNQRVLDADRLPELLAATRSRERVSSARNRLSGVVTSVVRDGVMAQVELACGDYRLVSLMSREAADELGLEPGVAASAVVKATNVIVEIDAPRLAAPAAGE
ncbi:TOBE domain-containing protein [Nocardioides sp. BP30]|uniref:TOBE domain-containing protein n=1 Tax=Nocardioides sp. BP30 TaxID=3036374 RepID=UPI0024688B23|nr:TOBE domain-containing protein [Nocardioides sp. BP30]WGL52159.1 TOBE domain-containing protein [Nocardioides sp. BP30]